MNKILMPNDFVLNYHNINLVLKQFEQIINKETVDMDAYLDFEKTRWLNAELTTFIGTIVSILNNNQYNVYITRSISYDIKMILRKNGFMSHYNLDNKIIDTYDSTIPFKVISPNKIKEINSYLEDIVIPKINFHVSYEKIEIINSALFELIHNINEHSESDIVFMCGQHYPKKKKLVFSIADIGISIPKNIQNVLQLNKTDIEAIDWAIEKGNSTKNIVSSGLGLYDIRENILGQGSLTIISNYAFWQLNENGRLFSKALDAPYPGSLITISFSLDDKHEKEYTEDIINEDLFF